MAALELDWWIVHRQRDRYTYTDLARALALTSAALYNRPDADFTEYARLRADAMRLCDEAPRGFARRHPNGATEADWQRMEQGLNRAWGTLHDVVRQTRDRPGTDFRRLRAAANGGVRS